MYRVLVVDDESSSRLEISEALSSLGYEVVGRASSGKDAVAKAADLRPDVILMDIVMPGGMDGIEASYEIKKEADIPIIFLTSYFDDPLFHRIKGLKPAGYILKPFHVGGLRAAIETALSNQQIERRLIESEEKYRAIVENVNEGIGIARDGITSYVNQKLCEITGYSREELIGNSFIELIAPEQREIALEEHKKRLRGEKVPNTFTFRLIDKNGQEKWISSKDAVVTWEERPATLALLSDITDQKRAVDLLRDNEARLSLVLEAGELGWWDFNLVTGSMLFCDRWMRVLGYGPDEIKQHFSSWDELVHSEDRIDVIKAVLSYLRGGKPIFEKEFRLRTKTGQYKWILARGKTVDWDGGGKPIRIAGTHEDITDKRGTERSLLIKDWAVRSSFSGFIIADLEGKIMYANPASVSLGGWRDESEVVGRPVTDLWESPKKTQKIFREVLSGKAWSGQLVGKKRDGSSITVQISASAVNDEKGKPIAIMAAFIDTTEQDKIERLLRIQHEIGIALSSAGSLMKALNRLLYATTRIEGIDCGAVYLVDDDRWGLTLKTARKIPSRLLKRIIGFDADSPVARILLSGRPFYAASHDLPDIYFRSILMDDNVRGMAVIPVAYQDQLQAIFIFASFEHEDIPPLARTALEAIASRIGGTIAHFRTVESLLETQRNLTHLFDSLDDFLFILDQGGHILYVNPVVRKRLGYSDEDLLMSGIDAIHPPETRQEARLAVAKMRSKRTLISNIPLLTKDNRVVSVETKMTKGTWDNLPVLFCLSRDITERKRAQERLQHYTEELEKMNEEVRAFSYIVSHDLKAPLINVKGFADEIKISLDAVRGALKPAIAHLTEREKKSIHNSMEVEVPENLEFIFSSVSRMDSLISSILKLSRLGKKELDFEDIDMRELVRSSLKTLAHQIGQGKIRVTVDRLGPVYADMDSMETIIGNLVTNAVKFLDPGRPGRIEIWGEEGEAETTFYVKDNGRGIEKKDQERVFQIFYRSGKRDVPGEGMGLAYVKTLVTRHGGSIRCESEPGVGTTVIVTIPHRNGDKKSRGKRHRSSSIGPSRPA